MIETAVSRRRWLRFSLRAMLLVVLVVAVVLGWTMHKVRQQGPAAVVLTGLGCVIQYSTDDSLTVLERLRGLTTNDEPRRITGVYCKGSQITDAETIYFEALPE
jgi:hypothetical protein